MVCTPSHDSLIQDVVHQFPSNWWSKYESGRWPDYSSLRYVYGAWCHHVSASVSYNHLSLNSSGKSTGTRDKAQALSLTFDWIGRQTLSFGSLFINPTRFDWDFEFVSTTPSRLAACLHLPLIITNVVAMHSCHSTRARDEFYEILCLDYKIWSAM